MSAPDSGGVPAGRVPRGYRLLLRLYPRRFREAYGAAAVQLLRDELRDARSEPGRGTMLRAWIVSVADFLFAALLERGARLLGAGSTPGPRQRSSRTPRRSARWGKSSLADVLFQDLRYAVRSVVKNPGFSAIVVLTLALGVGMNAAIFTVVHGVLLRPLPFGDPDRLVMVWGADRETGRGFWWTSQPDLEDFEQQNDAFTAIAAYRTPTVHLTGPGMAPARITAARATYDLFDVLGLEPEVGRGYTAEEDRMGGERVVVLSHGLWQRLFGADRGIVGRSITINSETHTVVGIMPPGFTYPGRSELWLPAMHDVGSDSRGSHRLRVVARLKPGVTVERATRDMRAIAARLESTYPQYNTNRTAWVQPMYEAIVGDVKTSLLMLFAAVALVLLIACANVANLLLARGAARERELAVRSALGAGRGRLVRQLLTESLVLAAIGGGLGTLLGGWSLRFLLAVTPGDIPRLDEIVLDGRVVSLMLGVTLVAGMVFGIVPALHGSKSDLQVSLKEGTRGATVGAGRHRIQQTLVVAEVSLSVLLVISAGLLIKSFNRLTNVDPGFTTERVMTAYIGLPMQEYTDWRLVTGFYDRLLTRVRSLPGVQSAAVAYAHPLDPSWETSFQIEGLLELPQGQRPEARLRPVTPGYFRTAGIPLIKGRAFTERDDEDAPGVVIINESFARAFFKDVDPIGQRLIKPLWWDGLPSTFEIVGVTSEVKFDGLAREPAWAMYFPHDQAPMNDMYLMLRTAGEPGNLASAIRNEVWAIDPNIPLDDLRTMEDVVAESVGQPWFNMLLLGLFASLALVLAAVGIYGVISYAVAQRTNEIGIRRALGAKESRVLAMVLGQGLRLTSVGVAIGLVGAFWLSRLVSGLLFEVGATDPATFGAVAVILGAVGAAACYLPARRAMRVDPVKALRSE